MSKKIIGVTVGTPTSVPRIEEEIKPVKTVNGKAPDENGNVEVQGGGGGADGKDGVSPIISVSPITGGNRITITDKNGTKYVDVMDGADGEDGADGKNGSNGTNGKDGSDGADGVSISSVTQTTTSSADGGANIITVTLSNGTKSTFTVKNGSKGSSGKDGQNGSDGKDGNGIKSAVLNADYTLALTFDDGTNYTTPSIRGANGTNGKDGTSVTITKVSESTTDGGSNVVTFSDGKTLTVKNGKTGTNGKDGTDGKTPVKGTDYFTAAEISNIVTQAKAAVQMDMTYENWTFELEDGTTVTKTVVLDPSAPV